MWSQSLELWSLLQILSCECIFCCTYMKSLLLPPIHPYALYNLISSHPLHYYRCFRAPTAYAVLLVWTLTASTPTCTHTRGVLILVAFSWRSRNVLMMCLCLWCARASDVWCCVMCSCAWCARVHDVLVCMMCLCVWCARASDVWCVRGVLVCMMCLWCARARCRDVLVVCSCAWCALPAVMVCMCMCDGVCLVMMHVHTQIICVCACEYVWFYIILVVPIPGRC